MLSTAQLKRTSGKRYITLIELTDISQIDQLQIDASIVNGKDSWLIVEDIGNVIVKIS